MSKFALSVFLVFYSSTSLALYKNITQDVRNNETWITINVDVGSSKAADMLFIVDDSGSMTLHQQNLANQALLMSEQLSHYKSVNTAVITSSAEKTQFQSNTAGKFVGPVLNTSDGMFADKLHQQLRFVGNNGNYQEKFFDALLLATSEPLLSTTNAHFLRDDADLILIFLTDTEDQSITTDNTQMLAHLQSLKPNNDIFTMLIGIDNPQFCQGETQELQKLFGLRDFIKNTNGQMIDLCSDFAKEFPKAFNNMKFANTKYTLKSFPDTKIDFDSIKVSVDGQPLKLGDLINGWIYNVNQSQVIIGDGVIYNDNSNQLQITYKIIAQ